jgi:hypothetical protein
MLEWRTFVAHHDIDKGIIALAGGNRELYAAKSQLARLLAASILNDVENLPVTISNATVDGNIPVVRVSLNVSISTIEEPDA